MYYQNTEELRADIENKIHNNKYSFRFSSPKIVSFYAFKKKSLTEDTLEKRKRNITNYTFTKHRWINRDLLDDDENEETLIEETQPSNKQVSFKTDISSASGISEIIDQDLPLNENKIDIDKALAERNSNALNSDDVIYVKDTSKSLLQEIIDNKSKQQESNDPSVDLSQMSPKEFKKYQKEKREKEKLEEKEAEDTQRAFNEARREAHKRGYDTSILTKFDDPEEIYDLSNEEVDRVEAVAYINQDGFYDFVVPDDIDTVRRRGISTQRLILIIGSGGIILGCIAWFLHNILTFV